MIEVIVRLALLLLLPQDAGRPVQQNCHCSEPYMQDAISCDTTVLKNGALLYYQYTCDSMWLTLRQSSGESAILYSDTTSDLFPLSYRLAYQLLAEYDKTLLFRYGCPANGPCQVVVVNKQNGRLLEELSDPELLNRYVTIPGDGAESPRDDFLLYYSEDGEDLILFYLHTGRRHAIPSAPLRIPTDPDYYLKAVKKDGKKLWLTYEYYNGRELTRTIDLRRYPE